MAKVTPPPKPKPATDAETVPAAIQSAATADQLALFVLRGAGVEKHALPQQRSIVIGRGAECDVQIASPAMSRRHAALQLHPHLAIEDIGSHNGTWIGGKRLAPRAPAAISVDQVIHFGTVSVVVLPDHVGDASTCDAGEFQARCDVAIAHARVAGTEVAVVRVNLDRPSESAQLISAIRVALACETISIFDPCDIRALVRDTQVADCDRRVASLTRELFPAGGGRVRAKYFPRNTGHHELVSEQRVLAAPSMIALYRQIESVAAGTISVLVHGETGVGKEIVAEAIHRLSPRRDAPFLRLNCAALTDTLLESELFGHEKGAFTGATTTTPGLLESASGGTLFLDEIGELSLAAQVKLLRCVEAGEVMRVGAVRARRIDVRFVAATNRDLERETTTGTFRQDLYYRIAGATIAVPPLRARREEIEPMVMLFVRDAARRVGREAPAVARATLELLLGYHWPGNVRELRNIVERAVLLCTGTTIEPDHLPADRMASTPAELGPVTVAANPDDERATVLDALARTGGNQREAARLLGISRVTLAKRLDRLDIPRPRKK